MKATIRRSASMLEHPRIRRERAQVPAAGVVGVLGHGREARRGTARSRSPPAARPAGAQSASVGPSGCHRRAIYRPGPRHRAVQGALQEGVGAAGAVGSVSHRARLPLVKPFSVAVGPGSSSVRRSLCSAGCRLCGVVARSGVLCRTSCDHQGRGVEIPPISSPRPSLFSHPTDFATPAPQTSSRKMAFRGQHEHSLDAKDRITVPADQRAALADGVVVMEGVEKCVEVWPKAAAEAMEAAWIAPLNPMGADARRIRRSVLRLLGRGRARLGRPHPHQQEPDRARRALDGPSLIVGVGDHLEIWNADAWGDESRARSRRRPTS